MTVSSTTTKNSYSGNGSTTVFAYGFKVFDEDDLTVILRADATGTETVQSITTNYTVSGVGNAGGGNVTFVTAPATGVTVVIRRASPLTQTTDYTPNDPFPAASHEDALDNLTFIAQQQQEELDRAIKLSRTNTMASTEFTVGDTARANKILGFDGSGELSVAQELGVFRGDWSVSTTFAVRDLIKDTTNNNIYICQTAHTSSGSLPLSTNADIGKWELIVDAASATTSASAAAASATAAASSATDAETAETAAEAAQVAAETAETNAETAETNAETAQTAAETAQTAAETAQTAAETAETNAETSETNAAASETAAASSASSASTSAATATTQAGIATTKAGEASTSATNAATSETNAATSETNASTSASNAATSESNAATSESNASTSASNAATSATSAANSAAAAAASFDSFDDRYLGTKTSDPTVDNDGNALIEGALYFSSTDNEMKVYDGANWIAASSAGSASLILYEYTATSGQTTFSGSDDNAATLSYTANNIQVVMNGVILDPSDYTATNGTSVVLAAGATTGDLVNIYAFKSFTVADTVSASAGGTFNANVTVNALLNVDNLRLDGNTISSTDTNGNITIDPDGTGEVNLAAGVNVTGTVTADGLDLGVTTDGATVSNSASDYQLQLGSAQSTTGDIGRNISFDYSGTTLAAINSVDGGASNAADLAIYTGNSTSISERMRINSTGSLLVGMTSGIGTFTNAGVGISSSSNYIHAVRDGNIPLFVGRKTSDGEIIRFYKDGSTVGSIGTANKGGTNALHLGTGNTGLYFRAQSNAITPATSVNGSDRDNAIDLGFSSVRFDDIYATNGTIQTSDQNEKQQIASLTDAEITAAKAISKLFKTFKWNDSVAEKGDAARTHTGVIAQDVQQAMTDAGLDANDYAFFISTTWWEADETYTDDDGVEQTITNTYDTAEEAPEGATERNRKGIRYPQLLSFIGAATEQRLASIESRLDALESA